MKLDMIDESHFPLNVIIFPQLQPSEKYPSTFYLFSFSIYIRMINRVFFYNTFLLIFFSIFISDFPKNKCQE